MIIDVHSHTWKYPDHFTAEHLEQAKRARAGVEVDMNVRYEDYLATIPQGEQVHTIVFGGKAKLSGIWVDDQYVADYVAQHPESLTGFLSVDPMVDGWQEEMRAGHRNLGLKGGEVTWNVPLPMMQASAISVSVGGLPSHSHGEEEHVHGEESEFEAEGGNFTNTLVSANWASQYDLNDMNRMSGTFSGGWGDNEFGRSSQVYGVGFEYLWRENGYGPGGNSLRWRTEAMIRDIAAVSGSLHGEEGEHHEEDHHEDEDHHEEEGGQHASFDEFGIYSMLVFGMDDRIETGIRGDWVSGISEMGLDERFRVSPMFTWYLNEKRTLQARLQYNWDYSNQFDSEHSIWFQVGFNWGSAEVR